ncbi:MAG: hypothetical protein J6M12_08745 [Clostridia bacterium]|nr:hypothetical protein [Clostridia bacterium]
MEVNAKEERAALYEQGRALYFEKNASAEMRAQGLSLLLKATNRGHPQASLLVARLYFEGEIFSDQGEGEHQALLILSRMAKKGSLEGRTLLDSFCRLRYERAFGRLKRRGDLPLSDFDGREIVLNRLGKRYPVNAFLERKKGKNILHLQVFLRFSYTDELKNEKAFKDAVYRGIRAWQGEYRVFGGQPLQVKVKISEEGGRRARLRVMPLSGELYGSLGAIVKKMPAGKKKRRLESILYHRRSFAGAGGFWSAKGSKMIFLQSRGGRFDDLLELEAVTGHEFGHVLGLGDLYEGQVDGLGGVEEGCYPELDCYHIEGKQYNLVMCDHHAPIGNNDIEMVLLAFMQNKMQLYQPTGRNKRISYALGRGN